MAKGGILNDQNAAEDLRRQADPTQFDRAMLSVYKGLLDVHRRVIEEPWYGRAVNDVITNINRQVGKDYLKALEKNTPSYDQDASVRKAAPQAPTHSNDYSPDSFYGRNQEEQQEGHEHDYSPDAFYGEEHDQDMEQEMEP